MPQVPTLRVFGVDLDAQGRCAHYRSLLDIVSIRFPCCGRLYACHTCHDEMESHEVERWPWDAFDVRAVLCGECRAEMRIHEYLASPAQCSHCGARFNPRCALHHPLYFEMGPEEEDST